MYGQSQRLQSIQEEKQSPLRAMSRTFKYRDEIRYRTTTFSFEWFENWLAKARRKTGGCVSRGGIFKLTRTAEQKWPQTEETARLAQVVQGLRFKGGLQEEGSQRIAA
jgi:hypothetical protein